MKRILLSLSFIILATSLSAQNAEIIPQPVSIKTGKKNFDLTKNTLIIHDSENEGNAAYLQNILKPTFQKNLDLRRKGSKGIMLETDLLLIDELGEEGYKLDINTKTIKITATSSAGIFYGIQSLRQLLHIDIEAVNDTVKIQEIHIKDQPRFSWRSFMLDEARYFKGMAEVKKLLDQMALLKMNVFHWHLTDDQGWRIEINKYPKLTDIGSTRNNSQIGGWNSEERSGKPHGGFYTQDQIREIVAYATERQITIVPEIEMPGHASAAITSYPWLGTIGELKEVPVRFGKFDDVYNVADPRVYEFIENVLTEVMDLFPGKIIHIGGDEIRFDAWKNSTQIQNFMKEKQLLSPADLQIYFTNKVSNFIDGKEHRMMGWNEIMGGNVHEWQEAKDVETKEELAKSAIIHFWKGNTDLIVDAVTKGYEIVNSHHVFSYLDYSYKEISLEKAYSFEPIPEGLDKKYHSQVLGSGCQMWGEWIPGVKDMERMVYPRLAAYAEVGWTAKKNKNYARFKSNLNFITDYWKSIGINSGRTN